MHDMPLHHLVVIQCLTLPLNQEPTSILVDAEDVVDDDQGSPQNPCGF